MTWRNVESFTTLISIALADGSGLGASWAQVLKCLSEFQRLNMIGTGAKTDTQLFFPDQLKGGGGAAAAATPTKGGAGGASDSERRVSSSTRAIIQPTRPRPLSTKGSSADASAAAATLADLQIFDGCNSGELLSRRFSRLLVLGSYSEPTRRLNWWRVRLAGWGRCRYLTH